MSTETEAPKTELPPLTARMLIHKMYREWHDDRVSGLAAEIGFFALLSLFPLLLVVSAAAGWLGSIIGSDLATDVESQLLTWTEQVFGDDSNVADAVTSLFSGSSTSALTVGIVATLYTASRGFAAVVRGLDVAYGHHSTRGWVGTQVVGILLALGSIIVVAVTLAGLVVEPSFGNTGIVHWLWTWTRFPVAFAVLIVWAATIFHVAPNRRASWRWELPGALFSALLWLLATWFFSLYLTTLSRSSNAIFGVIGTAITLQLWLYLLAIGLILGAELNGTLATRRGPPESWTKPQLFTRGFRWIKRVSRRD